MTIKIKFLKNQIEILNINGKNITFNAFNLKLKK